MAAHADKDDPAAFCAALMRETEASCKSLRSPTTVQRAFSILTVKSVDEEARIIRGIATTPTPDRMEDVVEATGAEFTLPIPLLWHHDSRQPIGHVTAASVSADGIAIEARLVKVSEPGRLQERIDEAWQSIKLGLVRGLSIGFKPKEVADIKETWGLHFLKWIWLELSAVTIPANQDATITTVKRYDVGRPAATGTGRPVVRLHTPGASGTVDRRTTMNIQEQLTSYEATRAAKAARMTAIMQASTEAGQTLDAAQAEEYDGLKVEVKAIDDHLVRLHDLEEENKKAAKPVAGGTPDQAAAARGGNGHTPQIRVVETLPKGIGFARAVKCAVVARLDGRSMLDVAKAMYPSDDRLHGHLTHVLNLPTIVAQIKAAVPAGTTTETTWASALVDPTNLAGEFIEFLRPATIIGKFGLNGIPELRRVPFNIRLIEQTQGGTGYWVGQGAPKPLTAFGFAPLTLGFTKVASISVITEEIARFSTPSAEQLVRDGLRDALVERIDRDFIDPAEAGTANVQPASLTNGLVALTSAGTSADNARADLANIVADFVAANQNVEGIVIIMPTALALALSFMVNSLGQREFPDLTMQGGRINGLPVITSQYAANASGGGNLVIAVNAREVLLADDGQVTVDASREASLQMLDNPTNNAGTANPTTMVSMWQTNSIALRAERFINWAKRRTTAVVYMDDVNWGSIGSPA